MRVFYAAWPSSSAAEALEATPRPEHETVRWTAPASWHVTLQFVGEVPDSAMGPLTDALHRAAASCGVRTATVGPALRRLGGGQLVAPVAGVDDLAAAIAEASVAVGIVVPDRPFVGHVTLARARGRHRIPASLAGIPVAGAWTVDEITLVRSHLSSGGSTYDLLAAAALAQGP